MRSLRSITLIVSVGLLALGLVACGGDESSEPAAASTAAAAAAGESVVNVELGEDGAKYFVKVDKDTVQTGTTRFVINNTGSMHHEMAIFKTDLDPAALPLTDEDKVDEEKAGLVTEAVYTRPVRGDEDHRIRDGRESTSRSICRPASTCSSATSPATTSRGSTSPSRSRARPVRSPRSPRRCPRPSRPPR